MKLLAIGGAPATGKSHLIRELLSKIGLGRVFKSGLVVFHRWEDRKLILLGDYRKEGFAGTDRLSMAVQPQAVTFLKNLDQDWKVIFEGDRLFNLSFLKECQTFCDLTSWVLTAPPEVRAERCQQRNSNQDPTWLKGRESKVNKVEIGRAHV